MEGKERDAERKVDAYSRIDRATKQICREKSGILKVHQRAEICGNPQCQRYLPRSTSKPDADRDPENIVRGDRSYDYRRIPTFSYEIEQEAK